LAEAPIGGKHAIWGKGSGILSSEWIKNFRIKGAWNKPIGENEHRTSNIEFR
jgi:hypothetical protein